MAKITRSGGRQPKAEGELLYAWGKLGGNLVIHSALLKTNERTPINNNAIFWRVDMSETEAISLVGRIAQTVTRPPHETPGLFEYLTVPAALRMLADQIERSETT